MPLIKKGRIVDDDRWVYASEDAAPAGPRPQIFSLAGWQRERDALIASGAELGVLLAADQSPELIAQDLAFINVVALTFPTFKDGRAFSYARLLRERYGFTGELRAVGNVLRDQVQFMLRCGFDAFEVEKEADARAWLAATCEISIQYQPTGERRPWARTLRQQRRDDGLSSSPAQTSAAPG